MLKIPKLKELSFLVYGLGLSGKSVVKFFKKKILKISEYGMTKKRIYLKIIGQKI
jgi:hypothetical protein